MKKGKKKKDEKKKKGKNNKTVVQNISLIFDYSQKMLFLWVS